MKANTLAEFRSLAVRTLKEEKVDNIDDILTKEKTRELLYVQVSFYISFVIPAKVLGSRDLRI